MTYEVPRQASQTVLDVVTHIQRRLDPTLAYRFACRVGMCGSCAMTVNGAPRWTCRTHISHVVENGKLEVGPLARLLHGFDQHAAQTVPAFEIGVDDFESDFVHAGPAQKDLSLDLAHANRNLEVRL